MFSFLQLYNKRERKQRTQSELSYRHKATFEHQKGAEFPSVFFCLFQVSYKKKKNINLYSLTFHTKTELLLSIRKVLDLSISLVFLFFFQEKKSSFTSHMDKTILQKIKDDVKVAVVLHIFICLQV